MNAWCHLKYPSLSHQLGSKKRKVSFIYLQVYRVPETTLNFEVKADKLGLFFFIIYLFQLDFPAVVLPNCFLNFSDSSSPEHTMACIFCERIYFLFCCCFVCFLGFAFVSVSSYYILHLKPLFQQED